MDVRCERCRAQYSFDDAQVTEAGITVKCSKCGHIFKVKKKALVVTVPVKPGEATEDPITPSSAPSAGATLPAAAPHSQQPLPPERREWRVRQANGNVFTFKELTTLQKWIVEKKVSRDDEISLSGDQWKRLGNIAELATFFQVVEAAERGQSVPPALTPLPIPPGYPGTGAYPIGYTPGYPPTAQGYPAVTPVPQQPGMAPAGSPPGAGAHPGAAWESQPAAAPRAVAPEPAWASGGRRALPQEELEDEEARPARRSGARVTVLLVLLILVGGGAAVWYLRPDWLAAVGIRVPFRAPPAPSPVAQAQPPPKVEPPKAELPSAPAPAPPTAAPPAAADRTPEAPEAVTGPVMVKEPARPQARGEKQLLAEAERLRQRGKLDQALDLYGRVVEQHPESPAALAGRGWCYLDLSQYAPAEASFQAALALNSTHAESLIGLAETYRFEGRRAEAVDYYQKYLAAHPDGDDAAVARNELAKLKE